MNLLKLTLVICFLSVPVKAIAQGRATNFELVACYITPEAIAVTYKDRAGSTRRIAFEDKDKEMRLESPEVRGLLKWNNTKAIHVVAVAPGRGKRLMSVEYRDEDDGSSRVFEAGLIDEACLAALRGRYAEWLKFFDT